MCSHVFFECRQGFADQIVESGIDNVTDRVIGSVNVVDSVTVNAVGSVVQRHFGRFLNYVAASLRTQMRIYTID